MSIPPLREIGVSRVCALTVFRPACTAVFVAIKSLPVKQRGNVVFRCARQVRFGHLAPRAFTHPRQIGQEEYTDWLPRFLPHGSRCRI
jgi:hypothetical protein